MMPLTGRSFFATNLHNVLRISCSLPAGHLPPRTRVTAPAAAAAILTPAAFLTTSLVFEKQMPPRAKPPPDSEIEESYLKGSGPGGQKINKTSSAVQLKHIPTGLVVKSQATRSRTENRAIARKLLAQKLDDMYNGDQSRSAIVGEAKRKKAASSAKKRRRKYKKLEEEGGEDQAPEPPQKNSGLPNEAAKPHEPMTSDPAAQDSTAPGGSKGDSVS